MNFISTHTIQDLTPVINKLTGLVGKVSLNSNSGSLLLMEKCYEKEERKHYLAS